MAAATIREKLSQIDTDQTKLSKITDNPDGTVSLVYSGKVSRFNPGYERGESSFLTARLTAGGQLDVKRESCSAGFFGKSKCGGRRKSRRSKSKKRMTKRRR
jgi:hypothetical protein